MASNELIETLNAIKLDKDTNLLPENIKSGVTVLGVDGTLESNSGVKLFSTVEDMQADANPQEGDLAVVYREEIQNMTANTQAQYMTFPETVTLPEAVTSSYYCMLRAIDTSAWFEGQVQFSATSFRFEGYGRTGRISVQYTSADGITYTRNSFSGNSGNLINPVDLGVVIGVYSSEEWNSNMGYFMQVNGTTFDGLFEYKLNNINEDIFHFISLPSITFDFNAEETDQITNLSYEYSDNQYSMTKVNVCLNKMNQDGLFKNTVSGFVYEGTDGNLYAYNAGGSSSSQYIGYDDEKTLLGLIKSGKTEIITYKLDLENGTYEKAYTITFGDNTLKYSSTTYNVSNPNNMNSIPIRYALVSHTITPNNTSFNVFCGNSTVAYTQNASNIDCRIVENTYTYATTQYTLNAPNQLLPGVIAYGKNGMVTGDGSVYSNLDQELLVTKVFGDVSEFKKISLVDGSIPNSNSIQRIVRSNGYEMLMHGNKICDGEQISDYSCVNNNTIYNLKGVTLITYDLNEFTYKKEDIVGMPSGYSFVGDPTCKYFHKTTGDIYTFIYNSSANNVKIVKLTGTTLTIYRDFGEYSNQSSVYQILGYDDMEQALYVSITGWYQTTLTRAIYKVTTSSSTTVKSIPSYTYGYSYAWETDNYLGLSLGGDTSSSNKIYYKPKGQSTWKELNIYDKGDQMVGSQLVAYELSDGNIAVGFGNNGHLVFNPNTNTEVSVSETEKIIDYKNIMYKDTSYLYTTQAIYTLDGKLYRTIYTDSRYHGRVDTHPMYVIGYSYTTNSTQTGLHEVFPVKMLTSDFDTTNSILIIRENNVSSTYRQLNDFNYDILRDKSYDDTISPEEYTTAVNTTEQILGNE